MIADQFDQHRRQLGKLLISPTIGVFRDSWLTALKI